MIKQCVAGVFPTDTDPPDPETQTPATATTVAGGIAERVIFADRNEAYRKRPFPATYQVDASLLVVAFAIADRVLS